MRSPLFSRPALASSSSAALCFANAVVGRRVQEPGKGEDVPLLKKAKADFSWNTFVHVVLCFCGKGYKRVRKHPIARSARKLFCV